jgi:toxin ParE1/3/4
MFRDGGGAQTRPRAEEDLEQIWLHIALENPEAATRFLRRIEEKLARLAQFPFMGRARAELVPDLRSFPVHNYVILYLPLAEGVEGIEVVRVVHGREDIDKYFSD